MRLPAFCRPTLADLIGVFLIGTILAIGGSRLFGDADPATHVATGSWILANQQVPRTDPFSATHPGSWFAHEWLADVLFARLHDAAGWDGLVVLSALLVATAHVLLFRHLVRRGDDVLLAFVATVLAAAASSSHWLARPHLIGALILVIWVRVLDGVGRCRIRPAMLFALPPLALVWANMHGGFLVGLGVLAIWAISASLPLPARPCGASPRSWWLALAGSSAATLVNPYGPALHAHLLAFFAVPRARLRAIVEFAPPSLSDRAGIAVYLFLLIALIGIAAGTRAFILARRATPRPGPVPPPGGPSDPATHPLQPAPLLAFAAAAVAALTSVRHIEIAAIFGALVLSEGGSAWLRLRLITADRAAWEAWHRYETRHGGFVFALAVLAAVALTWTSLLPPSGFDPLRFPVREVAALRRAGISPAGPVLAPDWWGGYLILEWPGARVFVDGRSDMYGDAFMENYARIYSAAPDWPARLDQAGIEWALLPVDAPLARAMARSAAWVRWRDSAAGIVFRRAERHSPDEFTRP